MGRDGMGQVPCRGACNRIEIKLLCLGQGNGNHPVLERKRRMNNRIVLDIERINAEGLRKIVSPDKRGLA